MAITTKRKTRVNPIGMDYKITPTSKQRKVAETLAEKGGTLGEAIREAGYSEITSLTPQKVTESKGFRQIANEIGLTDDFVLKALRDDIEMKPQNRVSELALASKIKGYLFDKPPESEEREIEVSWMQEETPQDALTDIEYTKKDT